MCPRERIEHSLDVGLSYSLTRKHSAHLDEEDRWHDNHIDPLESPLHLRAGGGVEGFEGSRCSGGLAMPGRPPEPGMGRG
jgi:hypothetical protein